MIWESCYWKDPLLKSASYLRRVRFSDRTTERTFVRIEREIFIGFYSVRKLLDTFKVSDKTKQLKYPIIWHENIKRVTYHNWDHIDELYDLKKKHQEIRDIRFFCDKIIHSYIFMPDGETKIDGYYVASDRTKNQKCYYISNDAVISIFRTVGRDYPAVFEQRYDDQTDEIITRVY